MSVQKFELKPIEAVQWNGPEDNAAVEALTGRKTQLSAGGATTLLRQTGRGFDVLYPGDWVTNHEHVCGDEAFKAQYRPVVEPDLSAGFLSVRQLKERLAAKIDSHPAPSAKHPLESSTLWYSLIAGGVVSWLSAVSIVAMLVFGR